MSSWVKLINFNIKRYIKIMGTLFLLMLMLQLTVGCNSKSKAVKNLNHYDKSETLYDHGDNSGEDSNHSLKLLPVVDAPFDNKQIEQPQESYVKISNPEIEYDSKTHELKLVVDFDTAEGVEKIILTGKKNEDGIFSLEENQSAPEGVRVRAKGLCQEINDCKHIVVDLRYKEAGKLKKVQFDTALQKAPKIVSEPIVKTDNDTNNGVAVEIPEDTVEVESQDANRLGDSNPRDSSDMKGIDVCNEHDGGCLGEYVLPKVDENEYSRQLRDHKIPIEQNGDTDKKQGIPVSNPNEKKPSGNTIPKESNSNPQSPLIAQEEQQKVSVENENPIKQPILKEFDGLFDIQKYLKEGGISMGPPFSVCFTECARSSKGYCEKPRCSKGEAPDLTGSIKGDSQDTLVENQDLGSLAQNVGKYRHASGLLKGVLSFLTTEYSKNSVAPLRIGSMSKENGGVLSGHVSHQNGLDVDISYPGLNPGESASYYNGHTGLTSSFALDDFIKTLKILDTTSSVNRIFVSPEVKKATCARVIELGQFNELERILIKLRPDSSSSKVRRNNRLEFMHDNHFHVRLNCDDSYIGCRNQRPVSAKACE